MMKGAKPLTEPMFFDTDCISAFLWVQEESILAQMYPGQIYIPRQAYDELSVPAVSHLKRRIDCLIRDGKAKVVDIDTETEAYSIYCELAEPSAKKKKLLGRGEAACLALAKTKNGIIASNNFRDIWEYVTKFNLHHVTTGDIMVEAFRGGLITEDQANTIWEGMLKKRRKLGASSFSEYLNTKAK